MSNLKLSDAAAAILNEENAESILNKSRQAGGEKFGQGKSITADEQGESNLGTAGHKTTDPNYDAAKDIKQATLPTGKGVAAEPMKKLADQPGNSAGRKDLAGSPEGSETSCDDKVNRKKGPVAKATASANANAVKPYVPESEDEEDFEPEEASEEEVLDDLENMEESVFAEKYGMGKKEAVEYMYEADSCADGDEDDEEESEDDEEEKAKMSAKNKEKMKEDIDAMLAGENLSEEFKEKATTIFEAAVQSRVDEVAAELEEQFTKEFESALESVKEDFSSKLDSYLDYVVENWMEENKLAIEKGLRTEIAEDFIGALRNVFVEHYIDIPNEKEDIVEGLVQKVEDLEAKIDEEISKNINLKQQIAEHKKVDIIHSVCEGLTLSQVEKIKSLAENVEFVSEEDFGRKLAVIKESYFPANIVAAKSDALDEFVDLDEDTSTKVVDPLIEAYAKTISKTLKF